MSTNTRGTKLAEALYRKLISEEQLNTLLVSGFSESVTTDFMLTSQTWLGPLMLKADEISIAISGKRLWDVFYVVDKSCLEGIRAVDMSLRTNLESTPLNEQTLKTYDTIAYDDEVMATESYLIARLSLISSIRVFDDGKIDLLPVKRMPLPGSGSFEDGEVIPMYSEKIIKANFLSEALSSATKTNEAVLSYSNSAPSQELSRG